MRKSEIDQWGAVSIKNINKEEDIVFREIAFQNEVLLPMKRTLRKKKVICLLWNHLLGGRTTHALFLQIFHKVYNSPLVHASLLTKNVTFCLRFLFSPFYLQFNYGACDVAVKTQRGVICDINGWFFARHCAVKNGFSIHNYVIPVQGAKKVIQL